MAGAWVSIGYHEEELLFAIDLLRRGDTIVDVGANIGIYSMCAAAVGAEAIAFEPIKAARLAFEFNERINGVTKQVTVYPFALSDFEGSASMTSELESSNRFLLPNERADSLPVTVRKLDDVLDAQSIHSPTVLKVDAEGADEAVLRGARELLSRCQPAVIVEIWAGGLGVRSFLESLGYGIFHYNSRLRTLEPIASSFSTDGYFVGIHRDRLSRTTELLQRSTQSRGGPSVTWLPLFSS